MAWEGAAAANAAAESFVTALAPGVPRITRGSSFLKSVPRDSFCPLGDTDFFRTKAAAKFKLIQNKAIEIK